MVKWDRSIKAYVIRQARKYLWALPTFEIADLMQEAWIVFDRLTKSHGRWEMAERHGEIGGRRLCAAWVALFQAAVRNHFLNLARSASNKIETMLMSEMKIKIDLINRDLRDADEVEFEDRRRPMRAVEIACDLEHTPGIRRILERASWDQGVVRIREPRMLDNGQMETTQDVLTRLVGRRWEGRPERVRMRRRLPGGRLETKKAVRERMAARRAVCDFAGQLSMVV